jgi:hypothetical protein
LAVISELLRPQHGAGQIDQQQNANGKHDQGLAMHKVCSPHPIAEAHVSERDEKECDGRCYEYEIRHFILASKIAPALLEIADHKNGLRKV